MSRIYSSTVEFSRVNQYIYPGNRLTWVSIVSHEIK